MLQLFLSFLFYNFITLWIKQFKPGENSFVIEKTFENTFPSFHHVGAKLSDGKGISGRKRLTLARIDTIQNFYDLTIRTNKEDCKKMSKATRVILKHYSSTVDKPKHEDYPFGLNLWCSFQRDIANQTNKHVPIKILFLLQLSQKFDLFLVDLVVKHF